MLHVPPSDKAATATSRPRSSATVSITTKTRKLLWSRAGGRCANCRVLLTEVAAGADPATVLGEECHIAPRSAEGPRAEERASTTDLDGYDNLILLCAHHHKQVDDQPTEFHAARLRQLKAEHERWVADRLNPNAVPRVRLIDGGQASIELHLVATGRQLWHIMATCHVSSFEYPDDMTSEQSDAAADLLRMLEVVEIADSLNMGDAMVAQREITESIDDLRGTNLVLYAGRRANQLEYDGRRIPWSHTLLRFFHADDPEICSQAEPTPPTGSVSPQNPTAERTS
jgi:hypothetical protein